MASSKTISLKIALDGEREFRAAMQAVKKETGLLNTELKNLEAKYEGNANSMAALEAKQKALSEAQEAYTKRVKAAQDGLANAKKNEEAQAKRLEDLRDQLEKAREAMAKMEAAGEQNTDAYKKQAEAADKLEQEIKDQVVIHAKAEGAVSDWRKELSTAQTELDGINKEIEANDKYLDEAARSADGCATSIDKYGDEVGEAAVESEKLSVSLGDMAKNKLIDLAGDALMELGRKAIEAAKYVVEVGSSFEAQMDKVSAISGATGGDFDKLSEKAKEMGRTTKFTATEAAEAMEYMGMAGWKTGDMIDGLDGIMNLAAASGEDLATTSDIVTDALTAFGKTASDSGRLADIMAAASTNANTNVSMMGETFKYAAPIAGALGYSMEDTAVAIGLMANSGIKASQAGTSLRSGLTRLAAPTKQVTEAMDKYGISLTDSDGKMLSFRDLMVQLREKLGNLSETEQTAAANALFGKNAMSGWLAVLNGSEQDFDNLTKAIDGSNGAAAAMAETMQDNLTGKITILGSALEGLAIAAYNYISGPLQGAVEFVTGIISGITELISPHKTELETFIDDIGKANDQVARSIDIANSNFENTETEVAQMEASKIMLEGILDSAEKVNEIDLGNGRTAIIDASGDIVSFGFAPIKDAAEEAVDSIEKIDVVHVDGSTIKKDVGVIVSYFDPVADKVVEIEGTVDEFGKTNIDTSGITAGTEVVIEAFNDVDGSVGTAKGTIDAFGDVQMDTGATSSIGNIALAFDKLSDSASGTADTVYRVTDEFQKYQTSNIVSSLSNVIPELTEAWDEQSGVLRTNKKDLEDWFQTAEAIMMKEALMERQAELVKAQTNAFVDQQMALSAQKKTLEELNKAAGTAFETYQDWFENGMGESSMEGMQAFEIALLEQEEAVKDATNNLELAKSGTEAFNEVLANTAEGLGLTTEEFLGMGNAEEDAAKSGEDATAAAADLAEGEEDLGNAAAGAANDVGKLTDAQQKVIDKTAEWFHVTDEQLAGVRNKLGMNNSDFADWAEGIINNLEEIEKKYDETYQKVLDVNTGFLNSWAVTGETAKDKAESFNASLYQHQKEFRDWAAGMEVLGQKVLSGEFPQQLYDQFLEAGAQGNAGLIQGLAGSPERIADVMAVYTENASEAATSTENLMKYSSAGRAHADAQANATLEGLNSYADAYIAAGQTASDNVAVGITNSSGSVTDAATTTVSNANTAAETEAEKAAAAGEQAAESTASGIEQSKDEVKSAAETMIDEANKAGEVIAAKFNVTGQMIPQELKKGIDAIKDNAYVGPKAAIENMMQALIDAVQSREGDFHTSGYNSAVGVANGINAGAQNAVNAAIDLANAVNAAYNNTLVIQSPSKKMAESGKHTVEGITQGILSETPEAELAAKKAADRIAEAFEGGGRVTSGPKLTVTTQTSKQAKTTGSGVDTQALDDGADEAIAAMQVYAARAENLLRVADEKARLSAHYKDSSDIYQSRKAGATDDISGSMYALQSQAATATRYRLQDELESAIQAYEAESDDTVKKAIDRLDSASTKASGTNKEISALTNVTETALSGLKEIMDKTCQTMAQIKTLTSGIGSTLAKIAKSIEAGLEATIPVQIGNEQLESYTVRVVKKAINKQTKASKAARGR